MRSIHNPPSMPPTTLAHSPAFLAMIPISRLGEAHVEIERRRQCRGHAVAQLVEEDEGEHEQRLLPACAVDEFAERLDHRVGQRARAAAGELRLRRP